MTDTDSRNRHKSNQSVRVERICCYGSFTADKYTFALELAKAVQELIDDLRHTVVS